MDSTGRPISLDLNVTAQLKPTTEATLPTSTKWPWSKKSYPKHEVVVVQKSQSHYEVLYTGACRGRHKLHIQLNGREINGSPFTVCVHPDPTQLDNPVKIITDLNGPYGIACNSHGEMIVSERDGHTVSIFSARGQISQVFGSRGGSTDQMKGPKGIAVDGSDNIYVCSMHKLQMFSRRGELLKSNGQTPITKEREHEPCGITLYNNQVYVCDQNNHCIHVFGVDLGYCRSIGSHGSGVGELDTPLDIKFDTEGAMYIAEFGNKRVQVMDATGHFLWEFGDKEGVKLCGPSGLFIADKYVYVSDYISHCIVVYETSGKFVTSFGRFGWKNGHFRYPCCITSCVDGFIHVCDSFNGRVQIF